MDSPDWVTRIAAVRRINSHALNPRLKKSLEQAMNDPNTAVIEATTGVLAGAGVTDLRVVLSQLAVAKDDAGYHIRDKLLSLWIDGLPIMDQVSAILEDSPTDDVRRGAAEVAELLRDGIGPAPSPRDR